MLTKALRALAPLFLAALAVISCAAPVDYDAPAGTHAEAQAAGPCQIISWSVTDTTAPAAPGARIFTWKAMNNGSVSCPYKTQVVVTFPGSSVVIDGTVFSAAALAPYSVAGAKRTHSQTLLVGSSCNYEIWYKYKPNYPAGTEAWFFDGAYFC